MSEALISTSNLGAITSQSGTATFGKAVKVYIIAVASATFNIGVIPTHYLYNVYGRFEKITVDTEFVVGYYASSSCTLRLTMNSSGTFTIGSSIGSEIRNKYVEVTFLV